MTVHFGDDVPRQSLDWCKVPVFSTNHLAGSKSVQNKIKQLKQPNNNTNNSTNNY